MHFIEIDCKERLGEWSMSSLQSHKYFELYFLLEGTRRFFLNNKIFNITAPTVCIIPPFCMHKTEGDAYRRININVSADVLAPKERELLDKLGEAVVFNLDTAKGALFLELLESAAALPQHRSQEELCDSFLHVLLYLLNGGLLTPYRDSLPADTVLDSAAIQVAGYIHDNYRDAITLAKLCEKFFISRNTLCHRFRQLMHCSVMEYLQFIRISKAKELLSSTKKGMKEIAEECGFATANYFSLIFKQRVGISPINYRKAK
jgi:AraC-like DNA-binding protein